MVLQKVVERYQQFQRLAHLSNSLELEKESMTLKHLILSPPDPTGADAEAPRLRPDMLGGPLAAGFEWLLHQEGEAFTTLRPAGKARFGEQVFDVQSQGDYIDPGQKIVVTEVTGNRIIVRKA